MALADLVHDVQEPCSTNLETSLEQLDQRIASLEKTAVETLAHEGVPEELMSFEHFLNLRYAGSDTTFMIQRPESGTFAEAFVAEHKRQFSFIMPGRDVLVEDVRVRATAKSPSIEPIFMLSKHLSDFSPAPVSSKKAVDTVKMYFANGWSTAPLYTLGTLSPGDVVAGPATILDNTQTIVVSPTAKAIILERHVVIELDQNSTVTESQSNKEDRTVDPVQLSVMAHRFMSIAEQMGHALQKTSVSVNIKERLDFSCALFSPDGRLVANAPHVPVHLGSMEQAVMYQHKRYEGELRPGDVVVANHPISGGTHLPGNFMIMFSESLRRCRENILIVLFSRYYHHHTGLLSRWQEDNLLHRIAWTSPRNWRYPPRLYAGWQC
jgi:5-oxoprolinase (ATP-hydrolysing)